MRMADFDYDLPPERVAQVPARRRDESRLLVVDRESGDLKDARFVDLVELLEPGDRLVVNDTRVLPARLFARRPTGGRVEVLLVHPLESKDGEIEGRRWKALVRPGRKARPGDHLDLLSADGSASPGDHLEVTGLADDGARIVRLDVSGDPVRWIGHHGHVPLPPYIRRADTPEDRDRYQTVYARVPGAVAAPTAGLHFSKAVLERLKKRGVVQESITLHVGPGTFRPVSESRAEDHVMESEWFRIEKSTARSLWNAREGGHRIVAVGTTVVRALESAESLGGGEGRAVEAWTDLFIRPGHEFRWVDAMVTNFHLPRSTLLLLVSAFAGRETILGAYRHALEAGYRFYSYGDAMFIR